jgi:hypothetical protein
LPALTESSVTQIDTNGLARLGFWEKFHCALLRDPRMVSPGFSEAERTRLSSVGETVNRRAFVKFLLIDNAVTCVMTLIAVVGLLALLWFLQFPVERPPLAIALFVVIILIFGVDLLISRRIASALTFNDAMRAKLTVQAGDADLAAKVKREVAGHTAWAFGVALLMAIPFAFLWEMFGHYLRDLEWLILSLGFVTIVLAVHRLTRLLPPSQSP